MNRILKGIMLTAALVAADAATTASAQSTYVTRTYNIQTLKAQPAVLTLTGNFLTTIEFDDQIEEISSGNKGLFDFEVADGGNVIKLRATAKAGMTDLYVTTASGYTAVFILKMTSDANAGPRRYMITMPAPTDGSRVGATLGVTTDNANVQPTTASPLQKAPNVTATPSTVLQNRGVTNPTRPIPAIPVPQQVTPAQQAPAQQAPVSQNVSLPSPITVGYAAPAQADAPSWLDFATQTYVAPNGDVTVYYGFTNNGSAPVTINATDFSVRSDNTAVPYKLMREKGLTPNVVAPGSSEYGVLLIEKGTAYKGLDVQWNVKDDARAYSYSRNINAATLLQNR